jgi:hypothetical protein
MRETPVEDIWLSQRIRLEYRTLRHESPFSLQCLQEGPQRAGLIASEDAASRRLAFRAEGDKTTAVPLRGGEKIRGFREKSHSATRNFASAYINWSTRRGSTGFHQRPSRLSHWPTIAPSAVGKSEGTRSAVSHDPTITGKSVPARTPVGEPVRVPLAISTSASNHSASVAYFARLRSAVMACAPKFTCTSAKIATSPARMLDR